jgi:hypothetical protein
MFTQGRGKRLQPISGTAELDPAKSHVPDALKLAKSLKTEGAPSRARTTHGSGGSSHKSVILRITPGSPGLFL